MSVHLEPISTEAMRELLAGLVPGLPAHARDVIVARADGVPLYAVETVRMLLAQGRLLLEDGVYRPTDDVSALAVPETLTALISARLDELDAADRSLVADAAVLGQSFTPAAVAAVAGEDASAVEPRLRALVRRELLVQQVDPRSPERGQYAFVQALIREVAYNTLAKRDRKVRHLAAARFFETLETDELAGALAGHYLAAHGYAAEGAEADALAAQARVALRGAAERAAALGSHTAGDRVPRARPGGQPGGGRPRRPPRAGARVSAMQGLSGGGRRAARARRASRRGASWATARRSPWRRPTMRQAIAFFGTDGERCSRSSGPAWEEFSDLEETPAGRRPHARDRRRPQLPPATTRPPSTGSSGLLPIAERLDLLGAIAIGLARLSGTLFRLDRQHESMILLRGDPRAGGRRTASSMSIGTPGRRLSFREQFADPAAGLALAREGLEIASRAGSISYGFMMVGNAMSCALRTGEWDWATALLEEWLSNEITGRFYLELYADRAVLTALRGGDPVRGHRRGRAAGGRLHGRSPVPVVRPLGAGLGRPRAPVGSTRRGEQASTSAELHRVLRPDLAADRGPGRPVGRRRRRGAASSSTRLEALAHPRPGDRPGLGHAAGGLAALEGRRAEAIAGYREVLRGWRQLGLAFDEALAALDMAILLAPTERRDGRGARRDRLDARDADPARGEAAPRPAGRGSRRSRCRGPDGRRRSRSGALRRNEPETVGQITRRLRGGVRGHPGSDRGRRRTRSRRRIGPGRPRD